MLSLQTPKKVTNALSCSLLLNNCRDMVFDFSWVNNDLQIFGRVNH